MLKWFRKRNLDKLTEATKTYLETNYTERSSPKPASDIKFSREPQIRYSLSIDYDTSKTEHEKSAPQSQKQEEKPSDHHSNDGIQYSRRNSDIKFSDRSPGAQYSLRDNYDSESIQMVMRNLTAACSPLHTLKAIDENTNMSFVDKMLEHINKKHLRDSDVYKAAEVDRRLFSKIVSDSSYKPSKDTCIALCLAMKLSLEETNDLLSRAGYIFSHSNKRDVILEYFFREQVYSLTDVNEVLYRLEQKILGR